MHPVSKLGTGAAAMLAAATLVAVGLVPASAPRAEELKHYESNNKQFWTHPPDDWFMGDETTEQKGTHVLNTLPPPTGFTNDEIEATLKQIKLPPGFKIELWASGLPGARQMAWGDKGTLFVGSWFGTGGNVYAVVDEGGKRVVKTADQGHGGADRRRLPQRYALRRRHRQALQIRQRGSEPRHHAEGRCRL